ncbi:MAG: hypothetical protein KC983_10240 [Phycisphaerales bacterium]|nr:hypothetical protein [Phycisphaerales bacterium]
MTTPVDSTERNDCAPRLVALLERQQDRVSRLVQIASHQSAIIAERKTEALLRLLEQRQLLIAEFSQAQDEINTLAAELNASHDNVSPAERVRVRELIDGIALRIDQVVSRDTADQQVLVELKNDTGDRLRQLGTANKARGAYLRPNIDSNRFADTQG